MLSAHIKEIIHNFSSERSTLTTVCKCFKSGSLGIYFTLVFQKIHTCIFKERYKMLAYSAWVKIFTCVVLSSCSPRWIIFLLNFLCLSFSQCSVQIHFVSRDSTVNCTEAKTVILYFPRTLQWCYKTANKINIKKIGKKTNFGANTNALTTS